MIWTNEKKLSKIIKLSKYIINILYFFYKILKKALRMSTWHK